MPTITRSEIDSRAAALLDAFKAAFNQTTPADGMRIVIRALALTMAPGAIDHLYAEVKDDCSIGDALAMLRRALDHAAITFAGVEAAAEIQRGRQS